MQNRAASTFPTVLQAVQKRELKHRAEQFRGVNDVFKQSHMGITYCVEMYI